MGTYFKAKRGASVAIAGAPGLAGASATKYMFSKDRVTYVSDERDVSVFRYKEDLLCECDAEGKIIASPPSEPSTTLVGEPGAITYDKFNKKDLVSDREKIRQKVNEDISKLQEQKKEDESLPEKRDIDVELNSEDDLSVDNDDFDFEDETKKKKKIKNEKKSKKIKKEKAEVKKSKLKKKKEPELGIEKPKKKKKNKVKKSKSIEKRKSILERLSD